MRICLVVDNLNIDNGGGRFARDFVESFSDRNVRFEIVTFNPPAETIDAEVTVVHSAGWRFFLNVFKIRSVVKRCDIAHSFDLYPNAVLVAVALFGLRQGHVITLVGSNSVSPLHSLTLRWLAAWAANSARSVVAISTYTAALIHEHLPRLNISVIAPFSSARSRSDEPSLTSDFMERVDACKPYVLSVISRIKPRKGCIENVRTFARLTERLPDLKYIIVAKIDDTSYSRDLLAEIERLHLSKKVSFFERLSQEELDYVYANSSVHVMLSNYDVVHHDLEGFGLVYLEAAHNGILSIGNYDSGARDAIKEGVSGFLIRAHNQDDLVQRASEVARSILETGVSTQSDAAREFAASFTGLRSAEAYGSIYRSIIGDYSTS